MFKEVEFHTCDRTLLRGRFYPAVNARRTPPVIVMSGGFSAVMELEIWHFAEAFAQSGLSVLMYDHRGFGVSDGSIRLEADPYLQLSDMRDAITFAQTLPDIDKGRIGVWGSSFSGGHVLVIGATDRRVKCVVAMVPFISGGDTMRRLVRPDFMPQVLEMLAADRAARFSGAAPQMMPVITPDPASPAVLPTRGAYDWLSAHRATAPSWENSVTVRSLEFCSAYEPGTYAARVSPTPLLMIVGLRDDLTPPDLALQAFNGALEPKSLLPLDCGHFDPYDKYFDQSSSAALGWYQKHLG